MDKRPFVTKEKVEKITKIYPTPFHLYDEKGIRENVKALKEAFSWNKGYKEYFAVKATPNPFLIDILKEYGCGCDCSSYTELMMSEALEITGEDIMFSSNDTPAEEFIYADKLGAIINLDDITHIDFLEQAIGHVPETISCRFNPGGLFKISNDIMDNPGDAKYGMTPECCGLGRDDFPPTWHAKPLSTASGDRPENGRMAGYENSCRVLYFPVCDGAYPLFSRDLRQHRTIALCGAALKRSATILPGKN